MSKDTLHRVHTYYGFRFIYEELDGECLDENGNQLVITCMPDDSGCWVEDHSGEEVFRSSEQGVFLTKDKFNYYKENQ